MDDGPILIVEDDRDIRETLVDVLEGEGYTVVGAFDGLDALEKLREGPPLPSVILLDLMMPRMSGAEFCVELRKVSQWSMIPVVVVTADPLARSKAEAIGARHFVKKPLKLAELVTTIERALGRATH